MKYGITQTFGGGGVIIAFLALGLTGCNLNGVSFDVSGLPSLEVNGRCQNNFPRYGGGNCNLVWKNADNRQKNIENRYYVIREFYKSEKDYLGSGGDSGMNIKWFYGSKEATDKAYDNVSRRVDVDGNSDLFIAYNDNPSTENRPFIVNYSNTEYYIAIGGNFEENYTAMPSGSYQYNGKVVTRSFSNNTFNNGTVNAEVNFTDNMVVLIDFEGTGTQIDRRFEDIEIDIENGIFSKSIEDNENNTEVHVYGMFMGMESKGFIGEVTSVQPMVNGFFVAERSDTPVVAEN